MENNENNWIPDPQGPRRLRDILNSTGEADYSSKLQENPAYRLGVSDGRISATEEAKCVIRGLMRMWDDEEQL